MVGGTPRLLALDWGSTSLRAYLLGEQGCILAERGSDAGASKLSGGPRAFESALRTLAGDWLAPNPDLPIVACGMVGSKHGWAEAPYLSAPALMQSLATHARTVDTKGGLSVRIIPGISWQPVGAHPEVMRGEETQVAALLAEHADLACGCRVVLPGTHSKWVTVRQAAIESFVTYMTGELFDVLLHHSVLARTAQPGGAFQVAAFERGVEVACTHKGADISRLLFGVRTLGLFGRMTDLELADYASGLLIGTEIASAIALGSTDLPIHIVGEGDLVDRYSRAFQLLGRPAAAAAVGAAAGIWQVAVDDGWVR